MQEDGNARRMGVQIEGGGKCLTIGADKKRYCRRRCSTRSGNLREAHGGERRCEEMRGEWQQ
jgi:hypothetical protein